MIRLALTGSIGMGKSTVARMFAAEGIPVFDADAEVRRLQVEDTSLIARIGAAFPGVVSEGRLNRRALADLVLGDTAKLRQLEMIVHPEVRAARESFVNHHPYAAALLFEIPLLFETGEETEFDKVIVVSAPLETQHRRVLQRPDMTAEKLNAISTRQMPDQEKRRLADFVIDTGGDLSTTEAQVRNILSCLGLAPAR